MKICGNNLDWYVLYAKCKTIARETKVTSGMIWGCQWDATLRWFLKSSDEDVRTFVTDSTNKGNYSKTFLPTGTIDDYSVNNIYDMAGNRNEWTLEALGATGRTQRGSYTWRDGKEEPVSDRAHANPGGWASTGYSSACRSVLNI